MGFVICDIHNAISTHSKDENTKVIYFLLTTEK